ncbi:cory-CC-star protein [Alteribacillus sp. HJP-4]|uniref:cory-CC-star protein n=1 Tax=Alteribacillus sp. HJP-4 TaxID=2775394 RepID=UPI0035CD1292
MEKKLSIRSLLEFYDEVLKLPHRAEIKREIRDEDDLFLLLCFSDLLGLPNPASYYTLELYPEMVERFHDWHLRMGMDKSPLSGIRCC